MDHTRPAVGPSPPSLLLSPLSSLKNLLIPHSSLPSPFSLILSSSLLTRGRRGRQWLGQRWRVDLALANEVMTMMVHCYLFLSLTLFSAPHPLSLSLSLCGQLTLATTMAGPVAREEVSKGGARRRWVQRHAKRPAEEVHIGGGKRLASIAVAAFFLADPVSVDSGGTVHRHQPPLQIQRWQRRWQAARRWIRWPWPREERIRRR